MSSGRIALGFLALAAALLAGGAFAQSKPPIDAGPYIPSPQSAVTSLLKMADIKPTDFVIDLGSGDGRIVLTAAKVFGASGVGIEIKDHLVRESNEAARIQGVADRVKFITADLFKTDISRATVLTMYLLPNTVNMLKDKLLNELKPGTKILSHDYNIADWEAEQVDSFDLEDKIAISGVTTTILYLYRVPARVAGQWTARFPAGISRSPVQLNLETARVVRVTGKARIGGRDVAIGSGKLKGEEIRFDLIANDRIYEFKGRVRGDAMDGTVNGAGTSGTWNATLAK